LAEPVAELNPLDDLGQEVLADEFLPEPSRPDIEKAPVAAVAFLPRPLVFTQVGLEQGDGLGGQTLGIRTRRFQRLAEVATGHAL